MTENVLDGPVIEDRERRAVQGDLVQLVGEVPASALSTNPFKPVL